MVLIGLFWMVLSGLSFLLVFFFVDFFFVDKCLLNMLIFCLFWGMYDLYLIFLFGIGILFIIIVFYSLIMLIFLKYRKKLYSYIICCKN